MQQTPGIHYIHRLSYSARERLVGVFVLVALGMGLVLFVYSREAATLFADKFVIYGLMDNTQGITQDADVIVGGVDAGRVKRVDVAGPRTIRLEMEMLERFHPLLREGAIATLDKPPMIGTARIVIAPGDPDRQPLAPGSTLAIVTSPGMEQMLADIGPAVREIRAILERVGAWTQAVSPEDIGGTLQQLHAAAQDAATISASLAAGQGVIGQLLAAPEPGAETTDVAASLARILTLSEQRLNELRPAIADAQQAAAELPALIGDLKTLTAELSSAAATVNVEVENLPELVLRTRLLMEQLDTTLKAVQNTWPISSSVPDNPDSGVMAPQPLP